MIPKGTQSDNLGNMNNGAVVMKPVATIFGIPVIVSDLAPLDQIVLVSVINTPKGPEIHAASIVNIGSGEAPKSAEQS